MRNFQDTFQTCKGSFISAFSICMTVPLTSSENWHDLSISFVKVSASFSGINSSMSSSKFLKIFTFSSRDFSSLLKFNKIFSSNFQPSPNNFNQVPCINQGQTNTKNPQKLNHSKISNQQANNLQIAYTSKIQTTVILKENKINLNKSF